MTSDIHVADGPRDQDGQVRHFWPSRVGTDAADAASAALRKIAAICVALRTGQCLYDLGVDSLTETMTKWLTGRTAARRTYR